MARSTEATRDKRLRNLTAKSDNRVSPRTSEVLQRTRQGLVQQGDFVTRQQLIEAMVRCGDLAQRTVENLIGDMVTVGWLDKRGGYNQRTKLDTRAYRLGNWPG